MAKIADKFPQLPTTVNELIADRAIRHALYLERYKTHLVEELLKEFNGKLEPALSAQIEKSLRRVSRTSKNLQTLFKDNGELVREEYKIMEARLYEQLKDFSAVESSWLIQTLQAQTPIAWNFVSPAPAMLKALVTKQPMEGAMVKQWFEGLATKTAFDVNRTIQMGMIEGRGIEPIVRKIKGTRAANYNDGILNAPRHHLRAVVQTSVSNINHAVRDEVYKANTDVVKGVQIIATLDTRTCVECMNLDGKVYKVDEGRRPPFHFACLPGDSLVLSRYGIVAVSKRWFDGELVIIQTASRRELRCTPNHPILTRDGWVPAESLNVRGHVVSDGGSEWESSFAKMDSKDIPTRIEDISESLLSSGKMKATPMPVSPEDFHGDGVGSKVAIITSNGLLGDSINSPIDFGKLTSGDAGPVFCDNIVHVTRSKFSGHVYNLQTQTGFYSAQGIITHNCRCTDAPVLKSWKELGIPLKELPPGTRASNALTKAEKKRIRKLPKEEQMEIKQKLQGQVPGTLTYPKWLSRQSAEVQNEALGIPRANMFRAGRLKLNEFIDRNNRRLTLAELARKIG